MEENQSPSKIDDISLDAATIDQLPSKIDDISLDAATINQSPSKIDDSSLDAATNTATPSDPPTNDTSSSDNIDERFGPYFVLAVKKGSCPVASPEKLRMVQKDLDDRGIPVPTNADIDSNTGYVKRQIRSEEELKAAAYMVVNGETFETASMTYRIPISTIRFYMLRKGFLQRAPEVKFPHDDSSDEDCDE